MVDATEGGGGAVVDLDALVLLAALRGSGLRMRRAGIGFRVTARAAEWARLNVCHPPVLSIVDMVAVHVSRRAVRTNFAADSPTSERTMCLVWRGSDDGGDLTLVIAFEDELGSRVPGSGTSAVDGRGRG